YNVVSGASSVSSIKVPSPNVTKSQANFQVPVPSRQTCLDTHVGYEARITLKIEGTIAAAGAAKYIINYGTTDALAAFPGNRMFETLKVTRNQAQTTINIKDILPVLLHCYDKEDLNKYQSL